MASIADDPGGRRRILFLDKNHDRKTIWLRKVSKRLAEEIKTRVESINSAAIAGVSLDGETAEWLGKIGNPLHAKLAAAGLVMPRKEQRLKLVDFVENYLVSRPDLKGNTVRNMRVEMARLLDYFGEERDASTITITEAEEFAAQIKQDYAPATAGRLIKRCKQFFRAAVRRKTLANNPFQEIQGSNPCNEARKFFVTLANAYKVIDACPNAEWRLIFALSRFGGLRCPSEHLALTWPDVDWERHRFRVTSSKSEHHAEKGTRWVPIFPELRPYLEEVFDQAAEGTVYVINRYRGVEQNLRTQLKRIIRRAGLEPWPKPFYNLRASRETELAQTYPLHVVCTWIGNTERIAAKHYLQVTEDYFALAAKTHSAKYSAHFPKTAQNTAQHGARTEHAPNEKIPELSGFSAISPAFPAVGDYPRQDSNLHKLA